MDGFIETGIRIVSTYALPLLLAITLHEAGHAFVANYFGDGTARAQGRMTLNPAAHIDPFGTILMPALLLLLQSGFLFGYAKPVPVVARNLRHPKRDMIWVALAGPGMNMLLAMLAAVLLPLAVYLPHFFSTWTVENLLNTVQISILLGIFNLMPIPPLDGSRVLMGILPYRQAMKLAALERYGLFIVLGFFILLPMLTNGAINPFGYLILRPTQFLYSALIHMVS